MEDNKKPYLVDGQRVSHDEYVKTKYEDLRVRVVKGKKDKIKAHAESKGMSLNAYINELIDRDMGE